jgi:hypothetical protein
MVMVMVMDTDCMATTPTTGGEGTTCTSKSNETKWIIKPKLVYFNISIAQKHIEEFNATKQANIYHKDKREIRIKKIYTMYIEIFYVYISLRQNTK